MKKIFTSFLCGLMAVPMMAQTFAEPQSADWSAYGDAPTAGETYYLANVATGQFVTGGNNWATQMSVTSDYKPVMKITLNLAGVKPGDGFLFKIAESVECKGIQRNFTVPANSFIFRDNQTDAYVDGTADKNNVWLLKNTIKYFTIRNKDTKNLYPNYANEYVGVADDQRDGGVVKMDFTEVNENTSWVFLPVNVDESSLADWKISHEAYFALKEYYAVIKEAQSVSGFNKDWKAADEKTDYDNFLNTYSRNNGKVTEAFLKNIEKNTTSLDGKIKSFRLKQLIANASSKNPVDITSVVLINPNIDGNTKGWDITYQNGKEATNIGYQGASYTNGNVKIEKFIEAWRNSSEGGIGDGSISQYTTIVLPKGNYRFEGDAIAVNQAAADVKSVGTYLFAKNGKTTKKTVVTTGNEKPEHFTVEFAADGVNPVLVGIMTEGSTANWMGADNFKIFALGTDVSTGISSVKTVKANTVMYNLNGQRVGNDYKGVVIINGKKVLR